MDMNINMNKNNNNKEKSVKEMKEELIKAVVAELDLEISNMTQLDKENLVFDKIKEMMNVGLDKILTTEKEKYSSLLQRIAIAIEPYEMIFDNEGEAEENIEVQYLIKEIEGTLKENK